MKWIEMLRVRSSNTTLTGALPALTGEIDKINSAIDAEHTFMAQHALYDGDLSVVVVWNNDKEPVKSRECLMLAERLQRLGTVDHAVWIPVTFFSQTTTDRKNAG